MDESWPDILEGASPNLPIDPNRRRLRRIQYPASSQQTLPRGSVRRHSGAEARALLERELAAISAHPEDDRPASRSNPQREARGQWRASSRHNSPTPLPAHVNDRPASKQKPVRPGSLMAALRAATPTAFALEERPAPERPAPQSTSAKWLPSRRFIVISIAVTIVGFAAHALLNRGQGDANIRATRDATPAANFRGVPAEIPLPTRRHSSN